MLLNVTKCLGEDYIHYAFIGDTQVWWGCTYDVEAECIAKGGSSELGQGYYSNKEMGRVMRELMNKTNTFDGYSNVLSYPLLEHLKRLRYLGTCTFVQTLRDLSSTVI